MEPSIHWHLHHRQTGDGDAERLLAGMGNGTLAGGNGNGNGMLDGGKGNDHPSSRAGNDT